MSRGVPNHFDKRIKHIPKPGDIFTTNLASHTNLFIVFGCSETAVSGIAVSLMPLKYNRTQATLLPSPFVSLPLREFHNLYRYRIHYLFSNSIRVGNGELTLYDKLPLYDQLDQIRIRDTAQAISEDAALKSFIWRHIRTGDDAKS